MQELVHAGPTRCPVWVGEGCLGRLEEILQGRRAHLVTDEHVFELHRSALPKDLTDRATRVPRGEAAKEFGTLGELLEQLAQKGLDRDSVVVTFGGGAACDLGGLAAALLLRGVDVVHLPTTLLAQVDASVGGKTAVNLRAGKNLVGRIYAPLAVLCDTRWLSTLPEEQWRSGLGEVLKSAVLSGEEDLAALEKHAASLGQQDMQAGANSVADTIARCVRFKAKVVTADEQERGERELLNLGHTFGHAIELHYGYGLIPHGLAVAAGIGAALAVSQRLGPLEDPGLPERLESLAHQLGLPAGPAGLARQHPGTPITGQQLVQAMGTDKKARAGALRFVGLVRPGQGRFGIEWDPEEVAKVLDELLQAGR